MKLQEFLERYQSKLNPDIVVIEESLSKTLDGNNIPRLKWSFYRGSGYVIFLEDCEMFVSSGGYNDGCCYDFLVLSKTDLAIIEYRLQGNIKEYTQKISNTTQTIVELNDALGILRNRK